MENKFILVSLTFPGVPKIRDLEPVMTLLSTDWVRHGPTSWILWSTLETQPIYNVLVHHLDSHDLLIVTEIDVLSLVGRQPQCVWDWFNAKGQKFVDPTGPNYLSSSTPLIPKE